MERKRILSMIISVLLLALSLCLTIGVKFVFHACPMAMGEMGKIMPCHWAEQGVFATGIVLSVMSLLLFVFKKSGERVAISACMIPATISAMLFPQVTIRLCMMPEMACRTTMRPAVLGITIVLIVVECVNIIINLRKDK
ncbi:MAG: DUF4418 family protein [Catonella sp.]|uniref:DUF4418 family protein n=1 Tax=Catonella sp. TaxID=2382125 RepID=UPI003FA0C3E1